ncbi:TIGR04255 family protein [soil metagenome]
MTRAPEQKRKLHNSPLVLVLAEIKFAPILTLGEMIPAIQDELRRKGFPGFTTAVLHQFQLGANAEPSFQASTRWVFTSKDAFHTVTLSTDAVALQVTKYDDFEGFLSLAEGVIDVLHRLAEPSYADRIGLRYVDAVSNIGNDMSAFFNETVLSFTAADLGVKSLLSSQHILAETNTGHLQIRVNQVQDSPLLPPDLLSPELAEASTPRPGVHAVLDIDSSDEQRSDFSWAAVEQRLWAVHGPASSAFWKAITNNALVVWQEDLSETK